MWVVRCPSFSRTRWTKLKCLYGHCYWDIGASHGNFLERRSLERGQFVASKLPRDELGSALLLNGSKLAASLSASLSVCLSASLSL